MFKKEKQKSYRVSKEIDDEIRKAPIIRCFSISERWSKKEKRMIRRRSLEYPHGIVMSLHPTGKD